MFEKTALSTRSCHGSTRRVPRRRCLRWGCELRPRPGGASCRRPRATCTRTDLSSRYAAAWAPIDSIRSRACRRPWRRGIEETSGRCRVWPRRHRPSSRQGSAVRRARPFDARSRPRSEKRHRRSARSRRRPSSRRTGRRRSRTTCCRRCPRPCSCAPCRRRRPIPGGERRRRRRVPRMAPRPAPRPGFRRASRGRWPRAGRRTERRGRGLAACRQEAPRTTRKRGASSRPCGRLFHRPPRPTSAVCRTAAALDTNAPGLKTCDADGRGAFFVRFAIDLSLSRHWFPGHPCGGRLP
jgi:hypothetical protein